MTDAPVFGIWVNGERKALDALHLSARDRGVTLADGLFETMRMQGRTVFRLERHLARIERGLAALNIPVPAELRHWVLEATLPCHGEVAIRLTVTRGVAASGVAPPAEARPTVIVVVNPCPAFPGTVYEKGLTAHVASGRRNEYSITAGLKTLAYTDAIAAFIEAQRAGADEALFLDTAGHCSEATSSNLFASIGGTLVTPPVSCGALPGITRDAVLEIAAALGVPSAERAFELEELLGADEAFLTSSLRGLAPLVRVGDRSIGGGSPGAVVQRFAAAYEALVREECA